MLRFIYLFIYFFILLWSTQRQQFKTFANDCYGNDNGQDKNDNVECNVKKKEK